MSSGFSLFEVLIVLTLSLVIFSIVVSSVFESTTVSKKVAQNQEILESIFHTVDTIKSDLSKCGMRLQEAGESFRLQLFEHSPNSFKIIAGMTSSLVKESCFKGGHYLLVEPDEFFKTRKKLLLYNLDSGVYEFNEIKDMAGDQLLLLNRLQNDFWQGSIVVVLKEVQYKYYSKQKKLKRKVDKGYFQPLIESVSDFFVSFFPESKSVLYRIEVNKKEQIRGYIFLRNMVQK